MAVELKLTLPVLTPIWRDRGQLQLHADCLLELASLSPGLETIDPQFGSSPIRVSLRSNPKDEPLLDALWDPVNKFRQYSLLVIEADGSVCAQRALADSGNVLDDLSIEEKISIANKYALNFLEHETSFLLLVANIIRPGSLSTVRGYGFVNGTQVGETAPFYAEHLFSAVDAARTLKWPRFSTITVVDTWRWLRSSGAVVDGIGVGQLGRAIAAFSHLTTENLHRSSSVDLVWILLGLEALYSKSNVGLKEQLLGKTEAILGPRIENKKSFGAVYDFRSRFLHGDVDLPMRFTIFNAVKKFEDFRAELSRNEDVALAALIATLQWMASTGVNALDFEYSLKPCPEPTGDAS